MTCLVCIQVLEKITLPESSQTIKCCFVNGRSYACLHTGYTGRSRLMHSHLPHTFGHIQPATLDYPTSQEVKGFPSVPASSGRSFAFPLLSLPLLPSPSHSLYTPLCKAYCILIFSVFGSSSSKSQDLGPHFIRKVGGRGIGDRLARQMIESQRSNRM